MSQKVPSVPSQPDLPKMASNKTLEKKLEFMCEALIKGSSFKNFYKYSGKWDWGRG